MHPILLAMAALVPDLAVPAIPGPLPPIPTASAVASPPVAGDETVLAHSAAVDQMAEWIAASGDNGGLPYVIVDKTGASLSLFDAKGAMLADVPVLIGIAAGDEATAGIGSKNLAEIGPAEKTTPAGRFRARYGLAAGRQRILWVDYAISVAIHPIPPKADKREQRRERLLSPSPDDNRITFGCINVASAFYRKSLRPAFRKKGGYVYVLPDTAPLETVFPRLRVHALAKTAAP